MTVHRDPKNSKFVIFLFTVCFVLSYGISGLLSFACFYYVKSIIGGVSIILITVLLTIIILIHIQNMEKHFSFSDITSAEICMGCSLKIKGYRFSFTGMRYIVFKKNKKYLFKIIYLPETERIFKQDLPGWKKERWNSPLFCFK